MNLVPVESPTSAEALINQLRCNSCHSGIFEPDNSKNVAPDLSHAGLRYKSSYLFEYLQNPRKVRNHIGAVRMPDFGFDP